ncbi:MAG: DNA mismatch endonuclease Vsr [Bacteroidetes bacterium]|nr:DNA mismatch endonuclease Vsr [Bacteroidota bacterium]
MTDVHSKKIRSYNMSQIKGSNTKPEIQVRKFLFSNGLRYKLHDKNLSGKPDIVLPKYESIVFVHGCFWHGHKGCRKFVVPKTRTDFWLNKINTNISNDKKHTTTLKKEGWKVFTVWECKLNDRNTLEKLLRQIKN